MKSFFGKKEVKEKYLSRVKAHAEADEIVKGKYWEKGKGCAVGCTIHGSDHFAYETELGIPAWLAYLEDTLFEGMSLEKAKKWPERFLKAIPVGSDLTKVRPKILIFILESTLEKFDGKKFPAEYKKVTDTIRDLQKELQ
jgi:hypothetical protein